MGAKGIGEIGIKTAAAVANAVYHATGRRVRGPAHHPPKKSRLTLSRASPDWHPAGDLGSTAGRGPGERERTRSRAGEESGVAARKRGGRGRTRLLTRAHQARHGR